MLSIQQCATLACLLDVAAPKPGNVHRGADFDDMTFVDFANSAVAIGPAIADAENTSVGSCVLRAIRATREVTNVNTNLGIVLLLAPLAKVGRTSNRAANLATTLAQLTREDAADVYSAIRLANPGGLGEVDDMDVAGEAPTDLLSAMRHAKDRDTIAQQYATGFRFVLEHLVPLVDERCNAVGLTTGIVDAFVRLLAETPDSLIRRKCGDALASQVSRRALEVIESGPPGTDAYETRLGDLDFWLRADGHRRNPGTSADLITAAIFVCLLDGTLPLTTGVAR